MVAERSERPQGTKTESLRRDVHAFGAYFCLSFFLLGETGVLSPFRSRADGWTFITQQSVGDGGHQRVGALGTVRASWIGPSAAKLTSGRVSSCGLPSRRQLCPRHSLYSLHLAQRHSKASLQLQR